MGRPRKKQTIEEFRAKVLAHEIMHTPEFMKKHLPKTGAFKNRFRYVKTLTTGGIQVWECDYIHLVFPGYTNIILKLELRIRARATMWKTFKIKIDPPKDLEDIEYIRIQRDVSEYIRHALHFHLGRYF